MYNIPKGDIDRGQNITSSKVYSKGSVTMQSRVFAKVNVAVYSESASYFFAIDGALAAVDTAVATSIADETEIPISNRKVYFKSAKNPTVIRGERINFINEVR